MENNMSGISFQGNIKITTITNGVKSVADYKTNAKSDKLIKQTADAIFEEYTPGVYQIINKNKGNPSFRQLIEKITGKKLQGNYFDNDIVSYEPHKIIYKDPNANEVGGIRLDIDI